MKQNCRDSNLARHLRTLLAAVTVLGLAACATTPSDPYQEAVERAQARWDAVIAGDLETAYTFYSPGFRSATSLIDFGVYMRMRRVKYLGATHTGHECDENRCKISFDMDYSVANPVPGLRVYEGTSTVEDTWVRTDGQWWYLPEK